jgi:hypothetical protein
METTEKKVKMDWDITSWSKDGTPFPEYVDPNDFNLGFDTKSIVETTKSPLLYVKEFMKRYKELNLIRQLVFEFT